MSELTIRSALDAIEAAINSDEKGDALAVLMNARDVLTAKPSLRQRLSSELNAVHLAVERLYGVISVALTALEKQDDIDSGIAVCLENAIEVELSPARERIRDALALLPEVSHG